MTVFSNRYYIAQARRNSLFVYRLEPALKKDISGDGIFSDAKEGFKRFFKGVGKFFKAAAPHVGDAALKLAPVALELGTSYANQRIDAANKEGSTDNLFGKSKEGREAARTALTFGSNIGRQVIQNLAAKRAVEKAALAKKSKKTDDREKEFNILLNGSGIGRKRRAKRKMSKKIGRGIMPF